MAAPKGNKHAKGNKGGGRPTLYSPAAARLARKLAILGATDAEIADALEVSETTLTMWKRRHVEFSDALKEGKLQADANVAHRLYQRALGYKHKAVKIVADAKTGAEHVVPYTEHYPPDTTACIFWLKNRQPGRWRDKQAVEHSGSVSLAELVAASQEVPRDAN